MALDFPATQGAPTDGTFIYEYNSPIGQLRYAWSGVFWYSLAGSDLDDLSNVEITDAKDQDVLVYNGNNWENEPDVQGGTY